MHAICLVFGMRSMHVICLVFRVISTHAVFWYSEWDLFLTVYLLFKCCFVAWQRWFSQKLGYCVCVKKYKHLFEPFCVEISGFWVRATHVIFLVFRVRSTHVRKAMWLAVSIFINIVFFCDIWHCFYVNVNIVFYVFFNIVFTWYLHGSRSIMRVSFIMDRTQNCCIAFYSVVSCYAMLS